MLDRTIAPEILEIKKLKLPVPALHHLDNGIPVYEINMGTQEVLKLEVIFNGGRPYEHKKLVGRATGSLLKEGSKSHTAAEVAEQIDFYGGSFGVPVNLDTTNVHLFSLTKHFDKLIPILAELINEPAFPEKELHSFIERRKQKLQVDLSRPDVVAYRKITEFIFGKNHPYGYNSHPDTYDALRREDLIQHFQGKFTSGNCKIIICGKTNDQILKLLNQHLGQSIPKGNASIPKIPNTLFEPQKIHIDHPDTVQTAIRIGCRLFNRKHPDFKGLYILNTILGGYFGSRLMANIREDKGYTYNIYSTLDTMLFDGYFYVGTEVGNEFVKPTIKSIYEEFEILQNDLVQEDELRMVRNYLLGNLLTMLDGPFNVSDIVKTMILEDLPFEDFEDLIKVVNTITAEEIRELARKYLNSEQMWEVVVGS